MGSFGIWDGLGTGLGSLGLVGSLGSARRLVLVQRKDFLGSDAILASVLGKSDPVALG